MTESKQPPAVPKIEALINTLRKTLEISVTLDNKPRELESIQKDLEDLNKSLQEISGNSALNRHYPYDRNPNHVLPYSPATGYMNPIAPDVNVVEKDDRLVGHVTFGKTYEGPPKSVHGSIVASVYDQVLALTNIANGTAGPTANLNINYLKPTPLYRPLRFECWVDRIEGKKVFLAGECYDGDTVVTNCTGLFIRILSPIQYSD